MKSVWVVVLLVCILSFSGLQAVDASEVLPPKRSLCKKLIVKTAQMMVISSALFSLPNIYHDLNASAQQKSHLGSGIYFDFELIWQELHPLTREAIEAYWLEPEGQAKDVLSQTVADLLANELYGDYEDKDKMPDFFPQQRDASTYFRGSDCDSRGVCRHKALILSATLEVIGIESRVMSALGADAHRWHTWVELPQYHLSIDPAADKNAVRTVVINGESKRITSRLESIENYRQRMKNDRTDDLKNVTGLNWNSPTWVTELPSIWDKSLGGFWR